MVIGTIAGALSTWGFVFSPFFGDVDTCGIMNLHGMPGVLGGLVSVVVPFLYADAPSVAWKQAAGLGATLVIAIATGAICGLMLKMLDTPRMAFSDETFWETAEDIPKDMQSESLKSDGYVPASHVQ
mmetsp:Transcript_17138/g.36782  ORF Transcript_17138/g.36782 Transcript_17138/m.36782 type:complete len:127 (-) Transcript_17138:225-605(-)